MKDDELASIELCKKGECEINNCDRAKSLVLIEPKTSERESKTLCPEHLVDFMRRLAQ